MIVYLNGRFIPEERAFISIQDRGFLYGDGLFESIRIYEGEPFLWQDHIERFEHGCEVLRITSPFSSGEIRHLVEETIQRNRLREGLVRFTLSRGVGPRGYSPKGADHPTFVVAAFPPPKLPKTYSAIISRVILPEKDLIADFKHLNKLHQIVARAEADAAAADEALLLDTRGNVVEGTTTNLFWVSDGVVGTPPVRGILAGTTRVHVIRLCNRLNIPVGEMHISARQLAENVEGIFVTSCAAEIMEVSQLDGRKVRRSPLVQRLKRIYHQP